VIVLKKGLRAVCTLAFVCLFSRTALAQSILNFPARDVTRITITNTTSYAADVKFTLYNGADGSPATVGLNAVSRRIQPRGQMTVLPSEIFRVADRARQGAWIQATSAVSGLEGFYFSGEFASGGEAVEPQTLQSIPYVSSDPRSPGSILLSNPTSQNATINTTFFNAAGQTAGSFSYVLPGHAQVSYQVPARATSSRVRSDIGILATAINGTGESAVVIRGQGPKAQAQALVAPYFRNTDNIASQLILSNFGNSETEATVTFFTDTGRQPSEAVKVPLKANSTASIPGPTEGWLLVESPGSPVSGLVLVASGNKRAALPLQAAPADRMLFARSLTAELLDSTLSLVGSRERDAIVTVTLSRPDGTTLFRKEVQVSPLFRVSAKMSEFVSASEGVPGGYLTIQSTAPVYGMEIINGEGGSTLASGSPQDLASGFQSSPILALPRITRIDPYTGPDGIRRIVVFAQNIENNATVSIGGRAVPTAPTTDGRLLADLPELEPGYVNVRVRSNGLESRAFPLLVAPSDGTFAQRPGQALFQKVEVLESGLDPNRTTLVPIRGARVEVWDPRTEQALSVSEPDDDGMFTLVVPDRGGLKVRVLSRLRAGDIRVLDNMAGGQIYSLTDDIGNPRDTTRIELIDTTRQAGAFNILDNIQRANAQVALSDPQFTPPPLTIYWSEKNNESVLLRLTNGELRSTFFKLSTNTAYILGDRNIDSDEFDDSVILHEYAHMLAARFSRDDSPGGPHTVGDYLDPRLAWSEGWANFFSSAVRGTSLYIDSKGPGIPSLRYDLEEDIPPNDRPGYWSEASVSGLLWDLLDENQDNVDTAQFPFSAIWAAFTDLRNVRYVYLPFFLETFLARNPGFSDALRAMVIRRGNIDFQPDVRPSVAYPFPKPIAVGETVVDNYVDSFTTKRWNLASSSHFWSFSTTTGGVVTITLTIDGLGAANNPNANDLDLYLLDGNGKRLELSRRGLNGQPEVIAGLRLNPGTYYVEVRSFYTAETNTTVFNSGRYRISVQLR
jgi:hypothetical protein